MFLRATVLLATVLLFASSAEAARLMVNTVATAEIVRDAALQVRVEDSTQVVRRGAITNGVAEFDVPVGLYTIVVDEAGYWSPRGAVYVPAGGLVHRLPVYRAATLFGRVNGDSAPASLTARFILADAPEALSAETRCAIENDRWACTVPAARLDVSVKAPGFIARHRFDVDAARAPVDFGTIELRRGASLVGYVAFAGKSRGNLKNAVVRLQRREVELEVRTNARGFFHFDGIAPGDYTLDAALEDLSSAQQHVRIMADLEAELRDPLLLETRHDLELTLQPRHDPYGRHWLVYVQRETHAAARLATERNDRVSDDGRVVFRGLPPGHYVVQVRSQRGDDWAERRIDVPQERLLHIAIDRTFLSGTVSLAGEPLQAVLAFAGDGF